MAGQLTIDTLKASSGVLATQNGMTGIAKAWVNFNGTTSPGTIRSSFNVTSVTKNSTGSYTVNYTTTIPGTPATVVSCNNVATNTNFGVNVNTQTGNAISMLCVENGSATDKTEVFVSTFGS